MTNHNNARETSGEAEIVERLLAGIDSYGDQGIVGTQAGLIRIVAETIKRLVAERDTARVTLAAWDIGSLPNDMTLLEICEARISDLQRQFALADKYKWQVRDTCARAEAAEKRVRELETEVLDVAISDKLDEAGAPLTWKERAEAAEKRIAELEAQYQQAMEALEYARAALSDLPGFEDVIDAIRDALKGKQP